MANPRTVVKIGGSLFDQPGLGPRLGRWLAGWQGQPVLLVAGGGAIAEQVRELDRCHRLGEEAAHWLALKALSVSAHFVQTLLPGTPLVSQPDAGNRLAVLDCEAFLREDEGRPGCLPHSWDVTSDAIAARAAVVSRASRLILLKSVSMPAGMTWTAAGRAGFVDAAFAAVVAQAPWLEVRALDFRRER
jgi:aspartokinase-like uncharacterized kinase